MTFNLNKNNQELCYQKMLWAGGIESNHNEATLFIYMENLGQPCMHLSIMIVVRKCCSIAVNLDCKANAYLFKY